MAGQVWCALCLLYYYCAVLSRGEDGSGSTNPIYVPALVCGSHGFHFMVYPRGKGYSYVRLTAFDQQGGAHVLSTQRHCGIWINRHPDGFVALYALYNGCYVYEENNEDVISIFIEIKSNPENCTLPQMKTLRCQKLRGKRAIDEHAGNKTVLVSFLRPIYFPTADETEASRKGHPLLTGLLDKEWARIVLVVGLLTAVLIAFCVIKRRCNMPDDKQITLA